MNTLKRNLSRERIKITFTGYGIENINQVDVTTNLLDRDTYPERLKRVSSSSSISSGSKLIVKLIYSAKGVERWKKDETHDIAYTDRLMLLFLFIFSNREL